MAMMTEKAGTLRPLEQEIAQLGPWFHNLHLPSGEQTAPEHPLGDFPARVWRSIAPHVPEDLRGWSALDIGCNAGFYAFELARRGAYVTAIDHDPNYLRQARWAAEKFGLADRVQFREVQVYDLAREKTEYDLVWFMGVFYHLRYPLLGLDIVSRKVSKLMVFQTMTMPGEEVFVPPEDFGLDERQLMLQRGWPVMAFIEHRLANDPTNWWAANRACVEALLRSSGLKITNRLLPETYFCEPDGHSRSELCSLLENEYRAATGMA